jgi:hypothetical protein
MSVPGHGPDGFFVAVAARPRRPAIRGLASVAGTTLPIAGTTLPIAGTTSGK